MDEHVILVHSAEEQSVLNLDMSTEPGADNGWRKRKVGSFVPPFKPRRAPSYLNTQARDPGFMKIDMLVGKMLEGMDESNVQERAETFNTQMRQFLHRAGTELLGRMFDTKKLTELVLETLRCARRKVEATGCVEALCKFDDIMNVLPRSENPSEDKDPVYAQMNKLVEEESKTYKIIQDGHKLEMARRGVTYVEWSDDEF